MVRGKRGCDLRRFADPRRRRAGSTDRLSMTSRKKKARQQQVPAFAAKPLWCCWSACGLRVLWCDDRVTDLALGGGGVGGFRDGVAGGFGGGQGIRNVEGFAGAGDCWRDLPAGG